MKRCVLVKGQNNKILQSLLDDGLDVIHLDEERLITYYEKEVESINTLYKNSRKLDLRVVSFAINDIVNYLSNDEINMIKRLDKIKIDNLLANLSSDNELSH